MSKALQFCIVFFLFLPAMLLAKDKPAYRLFNAQGKEVSYRKMIKQISQQDVVLIGELHNNPISHWLELEIIQSCFLHRNLVLGAEMFEQDNQGALSAYLAGKISAKGLDSTARLWRNYKTDYAPLVNFAKENHLKFIASNVPRKYASMVSKGGFEALNQLSLEEKSWMAPLPIPYDANLPGYQKMITMMPGHATPNMPKAQALKDATMAHFILKNWEENQLFIHVNGSYHSENYEGISWYLKWTKPNIKIATIATVSQKNITQLSQENSKIADYIICVEDDMTTTY
ncbi:ChaN family lipoprotein [Aquirufa aurantiipilula]|uniref:ChaN family lipoprotein n=1 Tax=Aquirufa aurantiipilula TaxID=2696561 RepID=A0ABT6BK55_9BACT|nr:ChaN family lipoprotein [Aquirufa aurantiipilula]MDF5690723.1 ChaN family lipoprotein [Aquirufa aurantiipilula]